MPQIGWFEILVIVVIAVLVIGPKDFPIVLRKIGGWIGNVKKYFSDMQNDVTNIKDSVENEIYSEKDFFDKNLDKKKDE
tara:strand:- start:247 stop:483 length:237 start_codon:yes stop_codon:yes gene_type:complete